MLNGIMAGLSDAPYACKKELWTFQEKGRLGTLNKLAYSTIDPFNEYFWLQGSHWKIQNRTPVKGSEEILLKLQNGSCSYSIVLTCYNNPGLFQMIQYLYSSETEPLPLTSEFIPVPRIQEP